MAIDLAYRAVSGARPAHTAFLLHGILGQGRNLGSLARRLVELAPAWRVLLVDLRNHGGSPDADPPQTLESCAEDLARLAAREGEPDALIAHSYSTKVALLYARTHAVDRIWLLDAPPGASAIDLERPGANPVLKVLHVLRHGPRRFASRHEAVESLVQAGLTRPTAGWLATHLVAAGEGLAWRFDLARIDEMIVDYYAHDLWGELERPRSRLRFVRGGKSDRLDDGGDERLAALAARGVLEYHVLPEAGHWLHADDLEGLARLIAADLA